VHSIGTGPTICQSLCRRHVDDVVAASHPHKVALANNQGWNCRGGGGSS